MIGTRASSKQVAHPDHIQRSRAQEAPVTWWAAFGAAILVLQVYVYGRWVFSDQFTKLWSGPDAIPLSFRIIAHTAEILTWIGCLYVAYRYFYRPWKERRSLPPQSYIFLTSLTIYWLDWSTNWVKPIGTWSGAFWINMGSWYNFIPGWVGRGGDKVTELNSFGIPLDILWLGYGAILMCWVMRSAKARWPQLGTASILSIAGAVTFVLDILLEGTMVRLGLYTFSASLPGFTLFEGHYFQFPLFEAVMMAPLGALLGGLLYFTDDRGRTWVERGIDKLAMKGTKREFVRFLAFTGYFNVLLIVFTIGWIVFSLQPGLQWTGDTFDRSYLRNGICGPGTPIACPASGIPPNIVGSLRIDPEGNMIDTKGNQVGKVELKHN